MKKSTLFDIISPVMIGPSSSHTAGAVRLGLLAKNIYKTTPKKVVFRFKDIKVKKEVSFDDKITFRFKVIGESEIEETNGNFNISKG